MGGAANAPAPLNPGSPTRGPRSPRDTSIEQSAQADFVPFQRWVSNPSSLTRHLPISIRPVRQFALAPNKTLDKRFANTY